MHRHKIEEFPLDHWQAVIDVNLTSTFLCCRAVTGVMKSQKSGAIVNISSDIGFSGDAGRSAYAAAKAGIVGFSKTLALELAPFGVRANVVAPGRIATKRVRATYSDAEWEAAAKRIPLGHAGEPEDIAEAVAFLASDSSRHMTGTNDSYQRRQDHAVNLEASEWFSSHCVDSLLQNPCHISRIFGYPALPLAKPAVLVGFLSGLPYPSPV